MPATRSIHNNFNGGEISPLVSSRTDQQRYYSSLQTGLNWLPLIQGGARVRGGFKYAGGAKSNAADSYLFPFPYSAAASYVLEFFNNGIRFWRPNASTGEPEQIVSAPNTPVEVVTTYTTAQLPDVRVRKIGDVLFIVHPAHAPAKLVRTSDTVWTLSIIVFDPPPTFEGEIDLATTLYCSHATGSGRTFTAGGNVFLQGDVGRQVTANDGARAVFTAYVAADTMTGDVLDGNFALVADPYASGEWTLGGSPNAVAVVAGPGPVGWIMDVAFQVTPGGAAQPAIRTGDVGKYIHILGGTMKITAFTSSSACKAEIKRYLSDYTSTVPYNLGGAWTLEKETWDSTRGYPGSITEGEQRAFYAGASEELDIVRGTETADVFSFATGTDDDRAVKYALPGVCQVEWLHFWARGLVVGTHESEIAVRGGNNLPMTPTSVLVNPVTPYGSAAIPPVQVGAGLLFCERGGRKVREFTYEIASDSEDADDLTDWADHLFQTYVTNGMAYQKTPYSTVWIVRSEGTLCALTRDRKQQVRGWSRHTTPASGTGTTNAVIVSACCIPNPVSNKDELWIMVRRTIGGGTVRYIEVLDFDRYLDCSYKYAGAATATITGLNHLNGQSVWIRGKDATGVWRLYPQQTVTGNQVTGLNPQVTEAEVGFYASAVLTTPRVAVPGALPLEGRTKGAGPLTLRCLNTPCLKITGDVAARYKGGAGSKNGAEAGYTAGQVYVIPTGTSMIATATEDGEIEVPRTGYDRAGRVTITQDLPLGGTVVLLAGDIDVGE